MARPSGTLCKTIAPKTRTPSAESTWNALADRHPIDEGVEEQTDQRRVPDIAPHDVRLLTEMEMSDEGVLGEMH